MTVGRRPLTPKAAGTAANGVLVCHTAFALFAVVGAPVVRPLGMPRRMELIAGYSVLIWNALVYGLLISTSQL